jgi:hypothetical protein
MLDAIDAFFDFVLVTNRHSPSEWDRLQEEALKWSDDFFQQYRTKIDRMAEDIEVGVLQKFGERRGDIEKNAFIIDEKGWNTPYKLLIKIDPIYRRDNQKLLDKDQECIINSAVEEEGIRPVLKQVISQMNIDMKQLAIERSTVILLAKNELLCAAFREVLTNISDLNNLCTDYFYLFTRIFLEIIAMIIWLPVLGVPFAFCNRLNISNDGAQKKEQHKKTVIKHYLVDVEHRLSKISEQIKPNLRKWLDDNHKQFKYTVNSYHNIVQKTMEHRKKAHTLSRKFSGRFARIECRLVANLDLAKHHGNDPMIDNKSLGQGGFFIVHPTTCRQGTP